MRPEVLERRIASRFDEISHWRSFRRAVADDDFQLVALLDAFGDVRGMRLLDVGCGKGAFAAALSARGAHVVGIDPSPRFIDAARQNVAAADFQVASATRLPFAAETFDGAYCVEVLEHIPEADRALAEIMRVIKVGGRLVILDKNIVSVEPRLGLPSALYKWVAHVRDRWMYPRGFPYRERWFSPWGLNDLLRRHSVRTHVRYFPAARSRRFAWLTAVFPFLAFDVAWVGVK